MRKHDKPIRNLSTYRKFTGPFRTLPDFFILGAQKSATTSLYEYLTQTPWICSARWKEVQFFNIHYDRGLNWYKGSFPTLIYKRLKKIRNGNSLTGEASADYLFYPLPAKRILQIVPKAKFIVILRNPIDRAYSHYNMIVKFGRENLSFEEAIKEENKRIEGERKKFTENENYYNWNFQAYSYLARGIYVNQIKTWMNLFPRRQFLILNFEEFATNPAGMLNKTMQFLGLPNWELKEFNKFNIGKYSGMKKETRKFLIEYFKHYNEELYKFLGINFGWK